APGECGRARISGLPARGVAQRREYGLLRALASGRYLDLAPCASPQEVTAAAPSRKGTDEKKLRTSRVDVHGVNIRLRALGDSGDGAKDEESGRGAEEHPN